MQIIKLNQEAKQTKKFNEIISDQLLKYIEMGNPQLSFSFNHIEKKVQRLDGSGSFRLNSKGLKVKSSH